MAEAPRVIEYVLGRLHQIGVTDIKTATTIWWTGNCVHCAQPAHSR